MPQSISDLLLEQYALGELSPEQQGRVREELERDPALRARLAVLSESDRQILQDYPPERIVPAIVERARTSRRPVLPRYAVRALWALPVAAAVILALSFGVLRPETRMKGISPHLTVFVQAASGAVELAPGAAARQGDRIQLSYTAAGAKYAAILSIDGRGSITWHLPYGYAGGNADSPAVEQQGRTVLPRAYELDDAPRFERFFFVYATGPFNLGDVQRAAQSLASRGTADTAGLSLARGVAQVSFLLKKG